MIPLEADVSGSSRERSPGVMCEQKGIPLLQRRNEICSWQHVTAEYKSRLFVPTLVSLIGLDCLLSSSGLALTPRYLPNDHPAVTQTPAVEVGSRMLCTIRSNRSRSAIVEHKGSKTIADIHSRHVQNLQILSPIMIGFELP